MAIKKCFTMWAKEAAELLVKFTNDRTQANAEAYVSYCDKHWFDYGLTDEQKYHAEIIRKSFGMV